MDDRTYSNGRTRDEQIAANARYRRRQAHWRGWIDEIATQLGMTRDGLTTESNAQLVARLLEQYNKEAGCR